MRLRPQRLVAVAVEADHRKRAGPFVGDAFHILGPTRDAVLRREQLDQRDSIVPDQSFAGMAPVTVDGGGVG